MTYTLIDSGNGEKLEQFGKYTLIRPCAQAVWRPSLSQSTWTCADAHFTRTPDLQWKLRRKIPEAWTVDHGGFKFHLKRTSFGHLGLFPEHAALWEGLETHLRKGARFLNLFAYSGGASLAAARAGAAVTHLDVAKGMVHWASDNAKLNEMAQYPIRWIAEEARKFLERSARRGEKFDAILLDPPTFGRGKGNQLFKIEDDLILLLEQCKRVLSETPLFVILSCHTPGYTPLVLKQLMRQIFTRGDIDGGDLLLKGPFDIPSGSFARWSVGAN